MNDKSQVKWEATIDGLLAWTQSSSRELPIEEAHEAIQVHMQMTDQITTLQSQLTQSQEEARLLRVQVDVGDAAFQQLVKQIGELSVEHLNSAKIYSDDIAAAHKERDESVAKVVQLQSLAALNVSLVERMKEAEKVLNCLSTFYKTHPVWKQSGADRWLKEGAK